MLLLVTVISLGAQAQTLEEIIDDYQYDIEKAIIEIPDHILTGNSVNLNYSVKAHIYTEGRDYDLKKDEQYNAEIKIGNTTVTKPISEIGDYTLIISGKPPYYGSQEKQFKVIKFASGDGSQSNPFAITTNNELNMLAGAVNSGQDFSKKYFKITNDISYSYTKNWNDNSSTENNFNPIGCSYDSYIIYKNEYIDETTVTITHNHNFNGTFDGDGHTIKGIRVHITLVGLAVAQR